MDLNAMLNKTDNADRNAQNLPPNGPAPLPPHPSQQHHHQPQPHPQHQQHRPAQSPLTQSPVQYSHRDYPPHQAGPPPSPSSGGRAMSHEYQRYSPHQQHQQAHANSYPPPASPYQAPGPSPVRPIAPALQPPNTFRDPRSPSVVVAPGSTPFRTPTGGPGPAGAGGYPFPPTHPSQEMQSPSQRHQPPPAPYNHQHHGMPARQDSYTHNVSPRAAPHMLPAQQQHPQQQQQQQHIQHAPQTPSSNTPGNHYHYHPTRSQSIQSSPTPTSAQSQHPFGPPYAQVSPITAARPSPYDYNRQSSQPPTPGGHPMSAGPRQPVGGFVQPSSPHQQRTSSTSGVPVAQSHPSPAAVHPVIGQPAVHRMSSAQSAQTAHGLPPNDQRRRSMSHREHSVSVSPKTRVSSITTNPDRPLMSREMDSKPAPHHQHNLAVAEQDMAAVTPAKRKLEDRDLSPRELEHKEPRPPPGQVNGSRPTTARGSQPPTPQASTPVPAPPRRRRTQYAQPPIWAQSAHTLGKKLPTHANFVLQKRGAHPHVNGKKESQPRADRTTSRRPSSETNKVLVPAAAPAPPPPQPSKQPSAPPVEPGPRDVLGAWEPSITGIKPYEEISRTVADYLFINVINNEDIGEIMSRGIQFEIEAKLGLLIDRDTNQRVYRSLASECILADTARIAFKSTMTEAHHRKFNEFLNSVVMESHPQNPNGAHRVPVQYKHRREVDRFFELSPALQERLPGCVRARLGTSRAKMVKARVTYDQKTDEVLAKIVKARVADLDLHMPKSPMDCRISINLEVNWDGPVEELERLAAAGPGADKQPDRRKDRLSYTQGHYQVDLTQVSHSNSAPAANQRGDKEHELEIEIAPGVVIDQGRRAAQGAPHRYQELVEGFVDNIRLLARKAVDFE